MATIHIFPFGKPVCSCDAIVTRAAALTGICTICGALFEYRELHMPSWTARERISAS